MRRMLVGSLVLAVLAAGCSGSADLSGTVLVSRPPGDVKPGTGLEVSLVPAQPKFEADWGQLVEAFHTQRARIQARAKEAEGVQADARAERLEASRAALGLLTRNDTVDWRAYDRATQRQAMAVEQLLKAGHRSQQARSQLEALEPRYRREASDLIARHRLKWVKTDAQGRFAFPGTPPGRYLLASRWRGEGAGLDWLVPVELRPHEKLTVDLTERNAGWPLS